MRAKDLRIGNWVYDTVSESAVMVNLDVLDQIVLSEFMGGGIHRYEQIQINDIYLKVFGLFSDELAVRIKNDTMTFELGIVRNKFETYLTCLGIEIRHLHELQNFYKVVTGKELIHKLQT